MRGPNETNKTNVSGVSRLALPRDSENTTPAKTPNRLHRITPVQVRPVRPYFCAEEEWVVMTSARQGSVLFFSPNRYGLGFSPPEKGGPRWLDGWAAATGLGSRWAPFVFPFWAPGSDGWAAATGLGFRWAPFMFAFLGSFPGSWVGWVRRLHTSFRDGWVGWVGRGQRAGLLTGSLHIAFLGSWVGWVGRGQEAGLALGSLHVSFFLGSWAEVGWVGHWASFMLGSR